ncbi:MAG: hypothetical protein NTV49_13960 [Kiritimatiellaeota bacterium]|nr:hypothetical protein [Kiritimatiellota bacterium]
MAKKKRSGTGLEIKTFKGSRGASYVVFKTPEGAFHVFQEVDSKNAAADCGSPVKPGDNTRQAWKKIWG